MVNYKIFVIFHDKINIEFYHPSILPHLTFVNVNPNNINICNGLDVITLQYIPNFISLGKWYTESEVIYNIYKNKLALEYDYIGFVHYDIDMLPITDSFLQDAFNNKVSSVNMQSYLFKEDYNQKILMDEQYPNRLQGKGKNCYISIFNYYNKFYNASHNIEQYLKIGKVNLCASFIMQKVDFENMMKFISPVIESKQLEIFDTEHKYRIQGGFLERYYAVWIMLKNQNVVNLKLRHEFVQTNNQLSFVKHLKSMIIKKVKFVLGKIN